MVQIQRLGSQCQHVIHSKVPGTEPTVVVIEHGATVEVDQETADLWLSREPEAWKQPTVSAAKVPVKKAKED